MDSIPQKRCAKCGVEKPLSEFHRWSQSKDGHKPDCKACRKIETASAYWHDHGATLAKKLVYRQRQPGYMHRRLREPTRCAACGELKQREDFYTSPKRKHGLLPYCKQCYKDWREANSEKHQQYAKAHYQQHRDKYIGRAYRWGAEHAGQRRIAREKWRKRNRIKARSYYHTYRARKAGNGGSYSSEEWDALCARYDYRCLCCGERKPLTADHIIPIAKGGSSDISNVQPLCLECNSRKGAKVVDYRNEVDPNTTKGPR